MTSVGPHLFWITSRAAGTAALVLASASVGAGLLIRSRGQPRKTLGRDARVLHEALTLATLTAVAVHGVALLGDHYLHPTVLDISVPFTGAYRPFWTGIGIIAGWGLATLGLSYYARDWIGQSRWRVMHRFTAAFWVLGIAHSIGAGTDAAQAWLLLLAVAVPAIPALILLSRRLAALLSEGEAQRPAARRAAASQPGHRNVILNGQEI